MKNLKMLILIGALIFFTSCDLVGYLTVTNKTGSTVQVINTVVDDEGYLWVQSDRLADLEDDFIIEKVGNDVQLIKKKAKVSLVINIHEIIDNIEEDSE